MKVLTDKRINDLENKFSDMFRKYMKFDYPVFVSKIDDEFEAVIEDLPGCVGYGPTEEAALKDLEINKRIWLLITFDNGVLPPTPKEARNEFKVLVRLPRELHLKAARTAAQKGMSFNSFVIASLRKAIGTPMFHFIGKEPEDERQNIWGEDYKLTA